MLSIQTSQTTMGERNYRKTKLPAQHATRCLADFFDDFGADYLFCELELGDRRHVAIYQMGVSDKLAAAGSGVFALHSAAA